MKSINALIAPMSCPISLFANWVSAYPAAMGAKIRPKFHPKMAMWKYKKIPYTTRPTAVPNAIQIMASLINANFTPRSLKFMLFVDYCSTICSYKNGIAHGTSKVIIRNFKPNNCIGT